MISTLKTSRLRCYAIIDQGLLDRIIHFVLFSLRLVDISDEILNSDVEMSNNENEDKNVIVSEVKTTVATTAKKSNNIKESKV